MEKKNYIQTLILLLCSILIAVAAVVLGMLVFVGGAVKTQAKALAATSIYEQTDYDFIIKYPSEAQIAQMSADDSCVKIVPFYQIPYTFKLGGKDVTLTVNSLDNVTDINYTEFAKARSIKINDVNDSAIYIDYGLAKKYKLKLGDKIGSEDMTFTVAGLYQNYDEQLAFIPDLKSILGDGLEHVGVYVKAKDATAFKKFLYDYKPLAMLKVRDDFENDESYAKYLTDFYGREYSSYYTVKSAGYNQAKYNKNNLNTEANNNYLLGAAVMAGTLFLGMLLSVVCNIKRIKTGAYNGEKKKIYLRYTISAFLVLISLFIGLIIGAVICSNISVHYITLLNILDSGFLCVVMPAGAVILAFAANMLIIDLFKEKGYRAKKKKQRARKKKEKERKKQERKELKEKKEQERRELKAQKEKEKRDKIEHKEELL